MEREERTKVPGDSPPAGGHSEVSIIARAPASDSVVPAQLWRDYLSSWIGGSQVLSSASLVRGGFGAPPAAARHDALKFPQSGHLTATGKSGGVNVTDCTTGGETCAPIS
jgi:hypothetical protein